MIVRDKNGNECNTEYVFAVEWCPYEPDNDSGFRNWYRRGKYKTMRAQLQALEQFRKDEAECKNRIRVSHNGGKTWYETHWLFRPVHLNYNI